MLCKINKNKQFLATIDFISATDVCKCESNYSLLKCFRPKNVTSGGANQKKNFAPLAALFCTPHSKQWRRRDYHAVGYTSMLRPTSNYCPYNFGRPQSA